MDTHIRNHPPLITHRLVFSTQRPPCPPIITPRMEFPPINVPFRDVTPPLSNHQILNPSFSHLSLNGVPIKKVQWESDMDDSNLEPLTPITSDLDNDNDTRSHVHQTAEPSSSALTGTPDSSSVPNLLVPKPPGDAGRPARGYNLKTELKWSLATYNSVRSQVHKYAKDRLNLDKCYKDQNKREIKVICDMVTKEFKILNGYEKAWPIHDMIKLHLKYTSSQARQKQSREAVSDMKKVLTRSKSTKQVD